MLLEHRSSEVGISELFAENVEKIKVAAFEAPSGADGIVGELRRFVGGVPALKNLIKRLARQRLIVSTEPFLLDHAAAGGRGRLLILAGKIIGPYRVANIFEGFDRFSRRMQSRA